MGHVPTLGGVDTAAEPLEPSEGWGVVHLFCTRTPVTDAEAVRSAVKRAVDAGLQVVPVAVLGHKADIALMALGADWVELRRLQTAVQDAGLVVGDSYVSLTEVSEYAKGMPADMLRARLYPQLPPEGKRAWCFYPMSKRRDATGNWYALPYEDRNDLMLAHGKSGRAFSGRILQLITGSAGLDDWEWGVTLFGVHPDDLKQVVYTMRFDEASAVYAEFGPFYAGIVDDLDTVLAESGLT